MNEGELEPVDILVVDDRPEDLLALGESLNLPHYRVALVDSPQVALKHLLERDFAVILLDVRMPEIDGFELARLIRERDRTSVTPIIFLTGAEANPGQIYKGYAAGAVDYLQKPVDRDVLRAKVGIFAELYRKDLRIGQQARALLEAGRRERELKLAELRVLAEKRYANLAEAIPELVVTLDAAGSLEYCNRRWQEYTGLSAGESRGKGWIAAIHPDDKRRAIRAWERSLASGEVLELECRLRRGFDGAMRWHTCRALPERDEDGSVTGWLGTYSDSEDLKQAIRARDEFLSIASHELRTPLTALKLRLESLAHTSAPDARARRKLDGAIRQTERLERLIDHLLDASRITAGHLVLERDTVCLAEMVREVLERAREQPGAGGQAFELGLESDVTGLWDRLRIEQVVDNLVSNALKYGAGKAIRVSARSRGEVAELLVEDRGIGIEPADLSRIFGQFERGAASRGRSGIGLGLFITRQIVRAHGGDIDVVSRPGEGSEFRVVLPKRPRPVTPAR